MAYEATKSSEKTPLLMTKAQASRGMEGSFPYSGSFVGAAAVFGVAVGVFGGKVLLSGVSAPQMASIQHTGQTTFRDQIINTEYTPEEHEWSHCLTTQMAMVKTAEGAAVTGHLSNSDASYAGWLSDGSAKSKLESMQKEELLHPIGTVMDANAQKIKIYLEPYTEQEISDNGAPLADVRAQVDDIKAGLYDICGNPLPEIDELGLLSNTSAACADTLYSQSGAVYDSYKLCQSTVNDEILKLDDYSEYQDLDFDLATQQSNVKELWEARKKAGIEYDDAFQVWFDAHNDALASCSYATNYQDLSSKVEDKFVSVLTAEKEVISKQCDSIPSLDDFEVTSVNVKARRSLLEDSAANPCTSILEALDGVSISQSSEHSGRALCLEYFCETASVKTEPSAKGHAESLLKVYNKAATAYEQASSAFGTNKKAHDDFQSAITTNLELIQGTQATVQGIQNATDDLKADFLITAACPISTICCKTAQEIPEICARDAAGEVADAVLPVEFTLASPPPPPSPPPSPPPPPPPTPVYGGVACASGRFIIRSAEKHKDDYCGVDKFNNWRCDLPKSDKVAFDFTQKGKKGSTWIAMRNGKNYCADEGDRIVCNRDRKGDWEQFKFTSVSGGSTVSMKGGKNSKYCADEGQKVKCDRDNLGGWEKYKLYCQK